MSANIFIEKKINKQMSINALLKIVSKSILHCKESVLKVISYKFHISESSVYLCLFTIFDCYL